MTYDDRSKRVSGLIEQASNNLPVGQGVQSAQRAEVLATMALAEATLMVAEQQRAHNLILLAWPVQDTRTGEWFGMRQGSRAEDLEDVDRVVY